MKGAALRVQVPLQQRTEGDLDVTGTESFGDCEPFFTLEPSSIEAHATSVATSFLYANGADAAMLRRFMGADRRLQCSRFTCLLELYLPKRSW